MIKKMKHRKPYFTEQELLSFLLGWSDSLNNYKIVQRIDGGQSLQYVNSRGEDMIMFIDEPGLEEAAIEYLLAYGIIPSPAS